MQDVKRIIVPTKGREENTADSKQRRQRKDEAAAPRSNDQRERGGNSAQRQANPNKHPDSFTHKDTHTHIKLQGVTSLNFPKTLSQKIAPL